MSLKKFLNKEVLQLNYWNRSKVFGIGQTLIR